MTKRRAFLAGSAAAASSSVFLGSSRAHAGDAEITLKLATVSPKSTPWAAHINRIKRRVKRRTDGKTAIKPYLGGALGDEIATLQRCQQGSVHMWFGSLAAFEKFAPEVCCFELPYLFPSEKAIDDIIDDVVFGDVEKTLKKEGFKLLFFSEKGWRSIGTNFGFVKQTQDLKGKRLATPGAFHMTETLSAMGALAQPIAVTDVMTALQTGVVDGLDEVPAFALAASFHQPVTHLTLTRHSYQPSVAVMNLATWNDLPDSVKKAVRGNPKTEAARGRELVRNNAQQALTALKEAGLQVHEPLKIERERLKDATASVHDKWTDKYGSTLYHAVKSSL